MKGRSRDLGLVVAQASPSHLSLQPVQRHKNVLFRFIPLFACFPSFFGVFLRVFDVFFNISAHFSHF